MPISLSIDDRNFVLAVVRRVLRCEDAANDATQDTLLAAFRHYEQFRGDAAFRTWLYRIAITTALSYLRRQRRSREDMLGDELLPKQLVDPAPRPDAIFEARELLAKIGDELPTLHRDHRAVLALRLADHSEPEIAAKLQISLANVKIRAFRARTRLREALAA